MKKWLKKLLRKIYVLNKLHNKENKENRKSKRSERLAQIKYRKKRISQDLFLGIKLNEFNMSEKDLDILNHNPVIEELLNLNGKYRGIKTGDHPSIYRKPANKSRQ